MVLSKADVVIPGSESGMRFKTPRGRDVSTSVGSCGFYAEADLRRADLIGRHDVRQTLVRQQLRKGDALGLAPVSYLAPSPQPVMVPSR
jgi:hypothetical protein